MRYIKITSPDIENGEGCRVTLWVAGCSHHCLDCHNPETWNYHQGIQLFWDPNSTTFEKISKELDKPYIQGLTLSGGDPLNQPIQNLKELLDFIRQIKIKYPEKDIWIYTGDIWEDIIKDYNKLAIIEHCDILVEGPYIKELRDTSLAFRGSSNQRIIDIKKSLLKNKIILYDN